MLELDKQKMSSLIGDLIAAFYSFESRSVADLKNEVFRYRAN